MRPAASSRRASALDRHPYDEVTFLDRAGVALPVSSMRKPGPSGGMADAADSKSAVRKDVWVRVPPRAPSYCGASSAPSRCARSMPPAAAPAGALRRHTRPFRRRLAALGPCRQRLPLPAHCAGTPGLFGAVSLRSVHAASGCPCRRTAPAHPASSAPSRCARSMPPAAAPAGALRRHTRPLRRRLTALGGRADGCSRSGRTGPVATIRERRWAPIRSWVPIGPPGEAIGTQTPIGTGFRARSVGGDRTEARISTQSSLRLSARPLGQCPPATAPAGALRRHSGPFSRWSRRRRAAGAPPGTGSSCAPSPPS